MMIWMLVVPAAWLAVTIVELRLPVARRGDKRAHADASLATGVLTAVSIPVILLALLVAGIRCDELCDETVRSWRYHQGAWQWTAQLVFAGIGLTGAAVALVSLGNRAYRLVAPAMAAQAAGWTAWGVLLWPILAD
jgi:hypothetical protein